MLSGPFLDRNWMGQNEDYASADVVMLGLPFDGTVSYRSGSRFAPEQIRLASWGLEEYSPYFNKHLQLMHTLGQKCEYTRIPSVLEFFHKQ